MAFNYTVNPVDYAGVNRKMTGTYVNDGGSTGGDIVTGLSNVKAFKLQPTGAAVISDVSVPDETFPLVNDGGVVTIVTTANESGLWEAIGV